MIDHELYKKQLGEIVPPPETDALVGCLVAAGMIARESGLLELEDFCEHIPHPFFRQLLQMAVDGTDPEIMREVADNYIESLSDEYIRQLKIIRDGILALSAGDNPRVITERLLSHTGRVRETWTEVLEDLLPDSLEVSESTYARIRTSPFPGRSGTSRMGQVEIERLLGKTAGESAPATDPQVQFAEPPQENEPPDDTGFDESIDELSDDDLRLLLRERDARMLGSALHLSSRDTINRVINVLTRPAAILLIQDLTGLMKPSRAEAIKARRRIMRRRV